MTLCFLQGYLRLMFSNAELRDFKGYIYLMWLKWTSFYIPLSHSYSQVIFAHRNEIGGRLCYTSSVDFWTWLKFLEEVLCYYLSSISRMVYLNLHVLLDLKDLDAEYGQ